MAERKTLNKYYPPNFDPSKIVRQRKDKSLPAKLNTVRLMSPFSMRCTTCGEYVAKGKKFNARKEGTGEKYLGISVLRFYIRCPRCSSEITFKTDPKNSDYLAERGAVRNYEPWVQADGAEETEEQRLDRLEKEEEENAMKELETKVLDTKREMAIADALDEIRTRNAMNEKINPEAMLDRIHADKHEVIQDLDRQQDEQDAETARQAFEEAKRKIKNERGNNENGKTVSPNLPAKSASVATSTATHEEAGKIAARTAPNGKVDPLSLLKKRKEMRSSLGIVVKKAKVI
ncbi:DUF572-domain-containing protein [Lipomyces japonicus]|uniref:DUF572-domain-containing protein n=1 Tax=Lipomyces japonicus TaxID=56871 RepID=UPI0034CF8A62